MWVTLTVLYISHHNYYLGLAHECMNSDVPMYGLLPPALARTNDYMVLTIRDTTLLSSALYSWGENAARMSEKKSLVDVHRTSERVSNTESDIGSQPVREGKSGRCGCECHLRRFVRAEEPPGPVSVVLRFGAEGLLVDDRRCCAATSVILLRRGSRGRDSRWWFS